MELAQNGEYVGFSFGGCWTFDLYHQRFNKLLSELVQFP